MNIKETKSHGVCIFIWRVLSSGIRSLCNWQFVTHSSSKLHVCSSWYCWTTLNM